MAPYEASNVRQALVNKRTLKPRFLNETEDYDVASNVRQALPVTWAPATTAPPPPSTPSTAPASAPPAPRAAHLPTPARTAGTSPTIRADRCPSPARALPAGLVPGMLRTPWKPATRAWWIFLATSWGNFFTRVTRMNSASNDDGLADIDHHVIGHYVTQETRVRSALDDVASNIRQAPLAPASPRAAYRRRTRTDRPEDPAY